MPRRTAIVIAFKNPPDMPTRSKANVKKIGVLKGNHCKLLSFSANVKLQELRTALSKLAHRPPMLLTTPPMRLPLVQTCRNLPVVSPSHTTLLKPTQRQHTMTIHKDIGKSSKLRTTRSWVSTRQVGGCGNAVSVERETTLVLPLAMRSAGE